MTKSITILTLLDGCLTLDKLIFELSTHISSGRKLTKSDLLNKILIPGPLCATAAAAAAVAAQQRR